MKENLKRVKIIQLPTLLKINKNGLQPFKLDNYFIGFIPTLYIIEEYMQATD